MVRYKGSKKPSKESQPRGVHYVKNQKKKAKKKAAKSGASKPVKKEEKKIEKAVEKKEKREEKKKPKAGNVGYMGVFDGTKQRSRRKNNPITVYTSPDTAETTYEGDWQGETCKTDGAGQNIFSGTANIVLINPKSLGASIENEARNWRYYEIDEMELWIEPLQGVVNTPGNICTAIETDPAYFAASGATLDFDTVNSYRPHVDHPVYVQDKPIRLVYKRKTQKTPSSNQFFYTYFDPTQFATSADSKTATGEIDANVRQCFQFALISYCKACTAGTELGVWQMRIKIDWRGNKKSQALPGFLEAEKYADAIINQNSRDYTEQLAEYKRRIDAGEFLQKPQHFPNPRQVDTFRVMALSYLRNYNATKNLLVLRTYQTQRDEVALYDRIKSILASNSLKLNQMLVPAPLRPSDITNPVSATPVVIVDPSLSTDPRLAANSKAAKVSSTGVLSTGSSGTGDVNIVSVGGAAVTAGQLNTQMVNASGQPLTVFSDGLGNRMLANLSHGLFVDDFAAPITTLRPNYISKFQNKDVKGATFSGYNNSLVIQSDGDNAHGAVVGFNGLNVGMPLGIGDGLGVGNSTVAYAAGTNSSVSLPVAGSSSTIAGPALVGAQMYGQFTTNATSGAPITKAIEVVSSTYKDAKSNSYTGYNFPSVGVNALSGGASFNTAGAPVAVTTGNIQKAQSYIQFTNNASSGSVSIQPVEAIGVAMNDSKLNSYVGFVSPMSGVNSTSANNGGQTALVDVNGTVRAAITDAKSASTVTVGTYNQIGTSLIDHSNGRQVGVDTAGNLQTTVGDTGGHYAGVNAVGSINTSVMDPNTAVSLAVGTYQQIGVSVTDPNTGKVGKVSSNNSVQVVVATTSAATTESLPVIDEKQIKKDARSKSAGAKPRDVGYTVVQFGYQCPKCNIVEIGNAFDHFRCQKCNLDCVQRTLTTSAVINDGTIKEATVNVGAADVPYKAAVSSAAS